eukprot:5621493-Pyramimonas_sp.AAC.1
MAPSNCLPGSVGRSTGSCRRCRRPRRRRSRSRPGERAAETLASTAAAPPLRPGRKSTGRAFAGAKEDSRARSASLSRPRGT